MPSPRLFTQHNFIHLDDARPAPILLVPLHYGSDKSRNSNADQGRSPSCYGYALSGGFWTNRLREELSVQVSGRAATIEDSLFSTRYVKEARDAACNATYATRSIASQSNEPYLHLATQWDDSYNVLHSALIRGDVIINPSSKVCHLRPMCRHLAIGNGKSYRFCDNCLKHPEIVVALVGGGNVF